MKRKEKERERHHRIHRQTSCSPPLSFLCSLLWAWLAAKLKRLVINLGDDGSSSAAGLDWWRRGWRLFLCVCACVCVCVCMCVCMCECGGSSVYLFDWCGVTVECGQLIRIQDRGDSKMSAGWFSFSHMTHLSAANKSVLCSRSNWPWTFMQNCKGVKVWCLLKVWIRYGKESLTSRLSPWGSITWYFILSHPQGGSKTV